MLAQNFIKLSAAVHELSLITQRDKKTLADDAGNNKAIPHSVTRARHVRCDALCDCSIPFHSVPFYSNNRLSLSLSYARRHRALLAITSQHVAPCDITIFIRASTSAGLLMVVTHSEENCAILPSNFRASSCKFG